MPYSIVLEKLSGLHIGWWEAFGRISEEAYAQVCGLGEFPLGDPPITGAFKTCVTKGSPFATANFNVRHLRYRLTLGWLPGRAVSLKPACGSRRRWRVSSPAMPTETFFIDGKRVRTEWAWATAVRGQDLGYACFMYAYEHGGDSVIVWTDDTVTVFHTKANGAIERQTRRYAIIRSSLDGPTQPSIT